MAAMIKKKGKSKGKSYEEDDQEGFVERQKRQGVASGRMSKRCCTNGGS